MTIENLFNKTGGTPMNTSKNYRFRTLLLFSGILTGALISDAISAKEFSFITNEKDSSGVYSMVEQMPQIVGGISELYEHIEYPKEALDRRIEGRVFVQFIVDRNGNVTDPEILKDIGFGCGEAAVKALTKISFTPGIQNGVEVPVSYTLPVTFKLGN